MNRCEKLFPVSYRSSTGQETQRDVRPRPGACVTRPFDAGSKALSARVKNCGAPTVRRYLDHRLVSVGYGLPRDAYHYGDAACRPKGNKPPTSVAVRLHRASLEKSSDGSESSVWHWAALAAIHEFVHTGDFIGYNSCAPWYTLQGVRDIKRAGYTERDINKEGFEKWTVKRSDEEYLDTFGVLSPYDPDHVAATDNNPCRACSTTRNVPLAASDCSRRRGRYRVVVLGDERASKCNAAGPRTPAA